MSGSVPPVLQLRAGLESAYADVLTPHALDVLAALAPLEPERRALMARRAQLRARRHRDHEPPGFLDPSGTIAGSAIRVADARPGNFAGGAIPRDLERQWVQGTGPAARPRAPIAKSLRSVAYALLSGADGWMFDGEDALGQSATMSLENQRSLKLAIARDPAFLSVAEEVAFEINAWAEGFLGRASVADWRAQLDFTTTLFRPRGLHLADRQLRLADGQELGAALVDSALFIAGNQRALRAREASLVLYLPKIQTAEEAAFWNTLLAALESALELEPASIRTYVLVEQLEASFQLMEIRAALAPRFVGFNTGRWDYINSVADACAWDPELVNPNIDAITMRFAYMAAYEDRVRRAVNTKDRHGRCALWQGGMEPNIPVGSKRGVEDSMRRALAGAEREQLAGASGKWVAHWKMVHVIRPVWEKAGARNQLGRSFPPLTYTDADARLLRALEPAPRTLDGARDLLSVALQYGNAFLRGYQAAALKPGGSFGNDDVLYLMEDMATGEIRASILWEWLHKSATLDGGERFDAALFARLLEEEHAVLLAARDRDVHDDSKHTTLPIVRAILERYVASAAKPPWYIDLLNLCLDLDDRDEAERRIGRYLRELEPDGARLTENLDFDAA